MRAAGAGITRTILACAVVALGVGASGCSVLNNPDTRSVIASFDRTIGLYEGSDVRILGVKVGTVTSITPVGESVRVEMTYEDKYDVPADAKAVIVAPSIVSDRYVQLAPAYTGGPVLEDGAVLEPDETAVPVELDEIFGALDEVGRALGPDGANADGALSDLLDVSARNLSGNGRLLNTTLTGFSTAVQTLADQQDDLFGTVRNLADVTETFARSDATVREFNAALAAVAAQLAAEREDLALAVRQLSVALGEVARFVRENKTSLTDNVSDLADITGVLVRQKASLEEFLDTAPTALSNLQLAYNPSSGTLDTRTNNFGDQIGTTLCSLGNGVLPQVVLDVCGSLLDGLSPVEIEELLLHPEDLTPELVERLEGLLEGLNGGLPSGTVRTPLRAPGVTLTDLMGGDR